MKIILATRNPSKAEQIRGLFQGSSLSVLTLTEAGIEGDAVEDGTTLQENALKKALFAWERISPKVWAMADDTGIFVHALDGEPGIRSSRWAGDTATTEEITWHTLKCVRIRSVVYTLLSFPPPIVVEGKLQRESSGIRFSLEYGISGCPFPTFVRTSFTGMTFL